MGECHAYRGLELCHAIRRKERHLLVDYTWIEPGIRDPQRFGIHGEFPCAGSLYLVGYGDIRFDDIPERPGFRWAAGCTDDLTSVRFLGQRASDILALRDQVIVRVL
jgi:hypothetical protein